VVAGVTCLNGDLFVGKISPHDHIDVWHSRKTCCKHFLSFSGPKETSYYNAPTRARTEIAEFEVQQVAITPWEQLSFLPH
jgi:hypothetical protein